LASKALLAVLLSLRTALANSFINRVLSANGLSNVIPISSRKVERWDIWTKAKVVILEVIKSTILLYWQTFLAYNIVLLFYITIPTLSQLTYNVFQS
jgi:hypothetical protein